jgi:hypothetical protein
MGCKTHSPHASDVQEREEAEGLSPHLPFEAIPPVI